MHSNFVPIDGVDSDGLAEMMALPPREVEMPGDGALDAMSYQSKHQDAASAAFAAAENQQSRLWSQERPQKAREEDARRPSVIPEELNDDGTCRHRN